MSWKDEDVAQEPTWTDDDVAPAPKRQAGSVLSRTIEGLSDPIIGVAQVADRVLVNPIRQLVSPGASSMDDFVKNREANYQAPEGLDVARMVGNVASPMNYLGAGVPLRVRAAIAAGAQSAMAPVENTDQFWQEKAKQAGFGAALGHGVSKVVSGITPTREAQALIAKGIQPSFGQSMGGIVNQVEQKATSLPFVGDAINYARNRASQEFEQAVLQRATQGAAKTLDEANAHASRLYDEVVPYLKPTAQSVQNVQQSMRNALQNPELTDDGKKILTGLADKHFKNFGLLDGEAIKKLDSELGFLARKYTAGDPASKTLADEIYNLQGAFRTGLEHGLPPDLQGKLQAANRTYAQLIPVNKAASARADERIMPRALQKALARQQRTDVTRMKPDALIDNAVAVLPSTVPDSGTAGRIMLGGGGLAAGLWPQMLAGGAVASAGAARPVQRAMVGNTAWQKALSPYDADTAKVLAAALRSKSGE